MAATDDLLAEKADVIRMHDVSPISFSEVLRRRRRRRLAASTAAAAALTAVLAVTFESHDAPSAVRAEHATSTTAVSEEAIEPSDDGGVWPGVGRHPGSAADLGRLFADEVLGWHDASVEVASLGNAAAKIEIRRGTTSVDGVATAGGGRWRFDAVGDGLWFELGSEGATSVRIVTAPPEEARTVQWWASSAGGRFRSGETGTDSRLFRVGTRPDLLTAVVAVYVDDGGDVVGVASGDNHRQPLDAGRAHSDCPAATPAYDGPPESLPALGATTRAAVERAMFDTTLVDNFPEMVSAKVAHRGGAVFDPTTDEVVHAADYDIQMFISDPDACPSAPVQWRGIPIVFTLAEDGVGFDNPLNDDR